jgi:hypothetical protein
LFEILSSPADFLALAFINSFVRVSISNPFYFKNVRCSRHVAEAVDSRFNLKQLWKYNC